jgi:hypothetical protein
MVKSARRRSRGDIDLDRPDWLFGDAARQEDRATDEDDEKDDQDSHTAHEDSVDKGRIGFCPTRAPYV